MATIPKPLARSTPRIFYGWLIVVIAFCGSFITAGTGGYVFGQFIQPLANAFGWSVGFVSSITLVRSLTSIAVVPLVGRMTDRIGSRPVMLLGSLVGGWLFIALAFVANPIVFYIGYSVVLSIGYAMLGGIPSQAAVTRWFRRRRGLALSLVTLGISTGGVVMVPLTQIMLDNYGWRFALGAIGVGILLVMLPPVFFANRVRTVAVICASLMGFLFYGTLFLMSLYFQQLRGLECGIDGSRIAPSDRGNAGRPLSDLSAAVPQIWSSGAAGCRLRLLRSRRRRTRADRRAPCL